MFYNFGFNSSSIAEKIFLIKEERLVLNCFRLTRFKRYFKYSPVFQLHVIRLYCPLPLILTFIYTDPWVVPHIPPYS